MEHTGLMHGQPRMVGPLMAFDVKDLTPAELERVRYLDASQRVKRWHTEPTLHTQTVGEHTYGVVMLVLLLTGWEASRSLMIAAQLHDTAERQFGDVPGPTKRLSGVKGQFDALEDAFMARLGAPAPTLTDTEAKLLKMADNLEGALFCAFELRRGNREIQRAFFNYLSWIKANAPQGLAGAIYNQLLDEYNHVFLGK